MSRCRLWCAALLLLLAGCGKTRTDPPPSGDPLERLLPDISGLEGWSLVEGPDTYTPDTLWQYVDGIAPRYQTYGFRELLHVRYQLGDDALAAVTLDLYDMGGELGGFGIYSNVRSPESAPRDWCAAAHLSGVVSAAWKGNLFIHAEADDERLELIGMAEGLVARVCERVAGADALPAILSRLPPEGLVARSERYAAGDLLGFAFLPGGVVADYELGGRTGRLFYSELADPAAVAEAMTRFRAHQTRYGAVTGEVSGIGDGGFRFTGPGLGAGTALGAGRFVAGAHGDLAFEEQETLLRGLVDRL